MSDSSPDGPDTRRALLAVLCVLGLVAGSAAAPALSGEAPLGGLDSPTAPSDVPAILQQFDGIRDRLTGEQPSTQGSGRNLLGALSPGYETSVGGPVSQQAQRDSASVHFVATADESTYWRTGAYTEYTGSGWTKADVVPIRDPGTTAVRPDQAEWSRVFLRRPATALPAPWKPVDFRYRCGGNISCDQQFELTQVGGIRAESPVEAGATYRVQHVEPPNDPATLRQTRVRGSKVDRTYTTVDTTDRVQDLSNRVVGDAENRYDAAKAVERYLESEKTYSLSDVPEPGDQIADQFLFEQEQGYCEYYATSMVVMLRSQGIPARYVVGYAGGEQVAQNRYVVRGADAHAWVEVYFEHVGWVRFDPTPTAPRQAADDRLAADSPTYQLSLNETAVPGEDVTATVMAGGLPAPRVAVSVNGEQVGVTNVEGNVTFTVPYANSLEITARPAKNTIVVNVSDSDAAAVPGGAAAFDVPPPELASSESGFTDSRATPSWTATAPRRTAAQPGNESNGTTEEFGVLSNVRFEFDGQVEAGETMPLAVRLNGEPFANASISVAGVAQGRTADDGTITVEIPPDASGIVEITATRNDLTQTTTYPIDDLVVTTSPSLTAPLPWTETTARVTSGGEPVVSAVVSVNGDRVGTTDADGEVTFEMPLSRTPAVSATASDKRAVTYVDGVLPTFALAAGLVLSAAGGLALFGRRRGVTLDRVVATATRLARETASAVVQALVATADAIDELAAEFREAAQDGWRGVLAWLASLPGRVSLPSVRAWAVAASAALAARVRQDDSLAPRSVNGLDEGASDADEFGRIQAVWQGFVDIVGVEGWETKTPGEVARAAVRKGFPKRPVYALTDAFRAAAYGGRPESSRLERARSALASLRSDADAQQEEGGEQ
jgi:transglutaminase-like putative cysteine protease